MTFGPKNDAEWHSWAIYRHPDMFQKLWTNHLMENRETNPMSMDPSKKLITIDLAIYDEVQWQKIMHDNEKLKLMRSALVNLHDAELQRKANAMNDPMSCEERLNAAIQVDKLKVYPDGTMVREKMQTRKVAESHHDRVSMKHKNNDQHWGERDEYAHFDDEKVHNALINNGKE